MAYPLKYRKLLETKSGEVPLPAEVWLSFAVCGTSKESCGWSGWIIESVTDVEGKQLPAATEQVCEKCGKTLFRTEVTIKVIPAADQTPDMIPGKDFNVSSMEYE